MWVLQMGGCGQFCEQMWGKNHLSNVAEEAEAEISVCNLMFAFLLRLETWRCGGIGSKRQRGHQ